jgi:hypothetical protein
MIHPKLKLLNKASNKVQLMLEDKIFLRDYTMNHIRSKNISNQSRN